MVPPPIYMDTLDDIYTTTFIDSDKIINQLYPIAIPHMAKE
jgi:hypothetical protein